MSPLSLPSPFLHIRRNSELILFLLREHAPLFILTKFFTAFLRPLGYLPTRLSVLPPSISRTRYAIDCVMRLTKNLMLIAESPANRLSSTHTRQIPTSLPPAGNMPSA